MNVDLPTPDSPRRRILVKFAVDVCTGLGESICVTCSLCEGEDAVFQSSGGLFFKSFTGNTDVVVECDVDLSVEVNDVVSFESDGVVASSEDDAKDSEADGGKTFIVDDTGEGCSFS
jgi:hypothetical protein